MIALMQFDIFAARKIIVPNAQTVAVLMRQFIEAVQHISIS